MNKKQVIRINENQIKQIVMESVKRILKEQKQYNYIAQMFGKPYYYGYDDSRLALLKGKATDQDVINYFYGFEDGFCGSDMEYVREDAESLSKKGIYPDLAKILMLAYKIHSSYGPEREREAIDKWHEKAFPIFKRFLNTLSTNGYKQIDDEPEDWYERNEHGDFDSY